MDYLINLLTKLSTTIPLTVYSFFGGLVEEIIAPIPSPIIMTSAGTLAFERGETVLFIIWISFLAAIGKTIGAWVIYVVADKGEDIVLSRFGKFLGITHKEIESFGRKFNKTWKDDVILILLRAIPVIPGAPVAAVCGLIKLNMRTYLQSTFIGVWIRSMIFAFIGYYGAHQFIAIIDDAESITKVLLIFGVGIVGLFFAYKNKAKLQDKTEELLEKIK